MITRFLDIALVNLMAAAGLMLTGWLISLKTRNVTIADSLWGPGFVLIAWLTFFRADGALPRQVALTLMVTLWGLRLFLHLHTRNRGKGEDPRYVQWREKHGRRFWLVSLYKVFLVQALFQWLISLGVQYGQIPDTPAGLIWLDWLGITLWGTGLIIEASADWQLARFIADPANKGQVMDRYLWRYSRHPNYFGESLTWWGIFITVLSVPWGAWTVISPMVITYTLLRLTGVTLMEETIFKDNPDYRAYIERTSAFIPWFPKKK
ncbi:MAG: DUF1295 domain-containing protein [Thermodesulfobacteriota bacterium]|nr:DUF1295 domain-containing protein [Thermodesulfobacteriota bacterium]